MRLAALVLGVWCLVFSATVFPAAAAVVIQPNRFAAASYNPSNDMVGMIAWYNPDIQGESDGAAIVTIVDATGNGNSLIQTEDTNWRAVLKHNVVNGRKTFRSDGNTGMYKDSFILPQNFIVFFAVSNSLAQTIFNHVDNGTWLVNLEPRFYDWANAGNILNKRSSPGFNTFSFSSTNGGQLLNCNGVPWAGLVNARSASSGRLYLFANQTPSYSTSTDYGEFLCYTNDATMTASRRALIEEYLCTNYAKAYRTGDGKIRVVCDGDSITFGAGIRTESGGDDSWPARLQAGIGSSYEVVNLGISGQTITQIAARGPMKVYPFHGTGTNVLFVWEYINDVGIGAQAIVNTISNHCIAARAAGWTKIVVGSDFHINSTAQTAGDAVRSQYANFSDGLAELDLQSLRDDAALFGDDIHLTTVGWQIVANVVSNSVKVFYP